MGGRIRGGYGTRGGMARNVGDGAREQNGKGEHVPSGTRSGCRRSNGEEYDREDSQGVVQALEAMAKGVKTVGRMQRRAWGEAVQ